MISLQHCTSWTTGMQVECHVLSPVNNQTAKWVHCRFTVLLHPGTTAWHLPFTTFRPRIACCLLLGRCCNIASGLCAVLSCKVHAAHMLWCSASCHKLDRDSRHVPYQRMVWLECQLLIGQHELQQMLLSKPCCINSAMAVKDLQRSPTASTICA